MTESEINDYQFNPKISFEHMKIAFWLSLFILFYTFLGYGIVLYFLVLVKRLFQKKTDEQTSNTAEFPSCTLVIAAYNEEAFIQTKINNTLSLKYPDGKLSILFVTDGSTDRTPDILRQYPSIKVLHEPERNGKVAAMHRAVQQVNTDIIIFTDANTELNQDALLHIARHYQDPGVGAVAGEKRIRVGDLADAGTAGEGIYWKYESTLKKWDSELYSVVGAAGELFSVRTELYQPVPDDTILDDFMISMLIAEKGFRIIYEPDAYAIESASEDVREELKRKIRIAAGGMQSIIRLRNLFNIFQYGILSFQYISHRVLRWSISPFLLPLVLLLNSLIILHNQDQIYLISLYAQILFYSLALFGLIFEKKQVRIKLFFIPYYFCVMNYAVMMGIKRYAGRQQSAVWEKARRKNA